MAEAALQNQRREETKQFIANFLVEKELDKKRKIEATQAEEKKIQARKTITPSTWSGFQYVFCH